MPLASHLLVTPRLLVVEDDTMVRTMCVRLLKMQRYAVDAVENGLQALERLTQYSYDIVLTDLTMPHMNGLALIEQIRDRYPTTDTIMITAFGSIDTAKRALKMGAFDYLTKPFEIDELERTVQNCLEMRELKRLRQETERLTEMVALLQLSRTISSTLDADTQVREFMRQLYDRFQPNGIALSLHDPDLRQLTLLGQNGFDPLLVGGQAIGVTGRLNDDRIVGAHEQLVGHSQRPQEIVQVLRVQDRPVGVLQLNWDAEHLAMSENDRQLLEVFTAQVAVALENSRLYGALKRQNIETITALTAAIDARDPYTRGHSDQVTKYAVAIAERMDGDLQWIERVRLGALLHDIGKIGQPDAILRKAGPLNHGERAKMQEHPAVGARIVESVRALESVCAIIEAHHEFFNGQGYPRGLRAEEIPLESRVIAVADGFDAMTSDRAYRKGMPMEHALAVLRGGRNEQWQGSIVDVFLDVANAHGEALLSKHRVAQEPVEGSGMAPSAPPPSAAAPSAPACNGGLAWLDEPER